MREKAGKIFAGAVVGVLGILMIVLAGAFFFGRGCFVTDQEVFDAIEKQGYKDLRVISKEVVTPELEGCGRGDDVAFTLEATNPAGDRVSILACAGYPFKGVTIRTK